jgi:hypothetical protein
VKRPSITGPYKNRRITESLIPIYPSD